MANHPESTSFDRDAGLRESFLYQLRSQERDILTRLTSCVLELAREGHCVDEYPEAATFAEVRGIAADLRFIEALMHHVASYEEEVSMELWHARLLVCVAELAPQVGELAARMEQELEVVATKAGRLK